ncbi:solute carrier family 38 member 10 [Discoglossus pictus]
MAASNWGLIMNIVNSIVGVSVLTMPFCFQQCGIVLGTLLLMLCSWMTHQSCMFLVKSASVSKRRTYAGLAFHAYGKAGKMLVETSMIGLMLGTCIAFYVVIGDLGSSFFARLLGLQVNEGFRVFLLFTVSLCIVLPLSLQRNMMASIQSFSAMALIFYSVFMFVIVLSSFKHGLFSGQWMNHVSYIRWEGIFRCIPIFGMSFACQSQVLPTYDNLDEPSVKIMSSIFAASLNVVTTFYVTVGFFGYVSFTESIAGNVLVNFPSNLVTEMLRVGFMMSVAVGFPMMILPCRQALNTLLFEQQQKDGTFTAGGYMPPLRFKVLTLAVVFGTMVGGIMIPNVETILGLTGATMGSLICFICPALIYRKIQKKGLTSQFMLGVGLIILVISTYTTLMVTEETPAQIKEALEKEELIQGKVNLDMEPELPKISAQKPIIEQPADELDKPKLPLKKSELEQPQIKGPIDVLQKDEGKRKQEEAQLDRPDQGVAMPMGEAHRHEPPVPQDDLAVDEGKDREESEEKKPPEADPALKGKLGGEAEAKAEENLLPNKDVEEQAPQQPPQEEGDSNLKEKDPIKEQEGQPPYKDLEVEVKDQQPVVEPKKNIEVAGDRENQPVKVPENLPVEGEKKEPAAVVPEGPNADQKPEDTQDEADKAELLDHAILLQVIKEQQVQQKRLLDQQEKLLEVIKEQHMEIHQQKEDEQPAEKLEGQAAELPKSKEEKAVAPEMALKQDVVQNVDTERREKINEVVDQPVQKEPVPAAAKEPSSLLDKDVKLQPLEIKKDDQVILQKEALEHPNIVAAVPRQEAAVKKQPAQEPLLQKPVDVQAAAENQVHHMKEKVRDEDEGVEKREMFVKRTATKQQKDPVAHQDQKIEVQQQQKPEKVAAAEGKLQQIVPQKVHEPLAVQEVQIHKEEKELQKQVPNLKQQGDGKEANEPKVALKPVGDNEVGAKEEGGAGQVKGVAPENEQDKPNRDLKLQNDMDLRRRKRELGEEKVESDGAQIISFHPVPNVKVNDLRGALESRLNQAAKVGIQVVQSRQIKQIKENEKDR